MGRWTTCLSRQEVLTGRVCGRDCVDDARSSGGGYQGYAAWENRSNGDSGTGTRQDNGRGEG